MVFVIAPTVIWFSGVVKSEPNIGRRRYERLSDVNLISQCHKQKRTIGIFDHRPSLGSWQIFLRH